MGTPPLPLGVDLTEGVLRGPGGVRRIVGHKLGTRRIRTQLATNWELAALEHTHTHNLNSIEFESIRLNSTHTHTHTHTHAHTHTEFS